MDECEYRGLVEETWLGKPEVLGGKKKKRKRKKGVGGKSQTHFVHHKSHEDWPGSKQQPQQSILYHVTSTFIFTDYESCYLLNL